MKTIKILSMAVLALVGAALTSCSKDDSSINDNPEQPTNPKNIVTLTTTISRDADDPTSRALTPAGVKTFAVGETMAVVYNNGTSTVKATSHALTAGDITNEGKSATFTFELESPNKSVDVTYIYPAAMTKDNGDINYAALNSQDGLLSTLASNLDYLLARAAAAHGSSPPTSGTAWALPPPTPKSTATVPCRQLAPWTSSDGWVLRALGRVLPSMVSAHLKLSTIPTAMATLQTRP